MICACAYAVVDTASRPNRREECARLGFQFASKSFVFVSYSDASSTSSYVKCNTLVCAAHHLVKNEIGKEAVRKRWCRRVIPAVTGISCASQIDEWEQSGMFA